MGKEACFENYPFWIVVVSNLVSFGIYLCGAFIIYRFGWLWLAAFLLFALALELRLLRKGCVNCYYYGKVCAFGRGKVSAWLFKKGSPQAFIQHQITWRDLLPEMLLSLIPLLVGIALLVTAFDWLILMAVIGLIVLTSAGNGFVRGSLACPHCKQCQLGCPAKNLFQKNKQGRK